MLKFLFSRIPPETGWPNILLVDDDNDIRTVTSLVLLTNQLGTVHEAATGQQGLHMARQQRPDIILLDIGLPDMGGETVLQLLKADPWTCEIPVILFTAYSNEQRRLRTLPVAGLVLKPFQPETLCDLVRRTLANKSPALGFGSGVIPAARKTPHGSPFAASAISSICQ